MRFEISNRTLFTYSAEIVESQNEVRACPVTDDCQRLLDYRFSVTPAARVFSHVDYWGTRVDSFGIRRPHDSMEVVADSSVETRPRPLPTAAPRLEALSIPGFIDDHIEYLSVDGHTEAGPGVRAAALRQCELAGPDVVGVVLSVHRFVGSTLSYEVDATEVGTPPEEVLSGGAGVCQDYAHLAVAMCRSLGIPARYVSGYLFTDHDAAGLEPGAEAVVVQTHAWFEAAIPGWGWLALDPTNSQVVGERHVTIGHGRSYDDVQPQRGVFLGKAESKVQPWVEIRRVAAGETWRQPSPPTRDQHVVAPGVFSAPPIASTHSLRDAQRQQQQQQQQ